MIIYGVKPVEDFIRQNSSKVKFVYCSGRKFNSYNLNKSRIKKVTSIELDSLVGNSDHQGLAMKIDKPEIFDFENLKRSINNLGKIILILDHIQDPHNLGAIIRTGVFFGVKSFVIPKKRSASITSGAIKSSAGAIFHSNVYEVSNISNVLKLLKINNYWTLGTEIDGNDINSKKLDGFKNLNLAIILGSEQKGVSKLLKKKCDSSISIYGNKKIDSLNVSVATGIILSKFANL